MNPDHDRVSERLPLWLSGELSPFEAGEIRAHLDSCERCSQELAALRALRGNEPRPLDDLERKRLLDSVRAGLRGRPPSEARDAGARRSQKGANLAPWLGAAALVAVIAIGVAAALGVGVSGGGGNMTRSGGAEVATQGEDDGAQERAGAAAPAPRFDRNAGALTRAGLRRIGRRSVGLRAAVAFAAPGSNGEAPGSSRRRAVRALVGRAPADVSAQVRSCARVALAEQDFPLLPVYGGLGTLDGDNVLVLGFVWTNRRGGRLDRFQMWAWPRGSCGVPVAYESGPIEE